MSHAQYKESSADITAAYVRKNRDKVYSLAQDRLEDMCSGCYVITKRELYESRTYKIHFKGNGQIGELQYDGKKAKFKKLLWH